MTPAEARALIADGRKHDEEMTPSPWVTAQDGAVVWGDCNDPHGPIEIMRTEGESMIADGPGVAWLRTNLVRLLDLAGRGHRDPQGTFAWLVVYRGGQGTIAHDDDFPHGTPLYKHAMGATRDVLEALRYARREDAQAVVDSWTRTPGVTATVEEHGFAPDIRQDDAAALGSKP